METDRAIERAEAALRRAAEEGDPRSPMAALLYRVGRVLGASLEARALFEFWSGRAPGSRVSDARYRWELHHERAKDARYCPPRSEWTPWRPRDASVLERDPAAFELRLTVPISIAEGLELLLALADIDALAGALLDEMEPVMRMDLASFVRGTHAFGDTFALYCLARAPSALERMRPFGIAIAACYAPAAKKAGVVEGLRFPFHAKPLTSASAMLAAGLFALGVDIPIAAVLADRVAGSRSPDGGFGDDGEPPDVLTTLVAAELLSRVEPSFDPMPSVAFVLGRQRPDGFFRALGPEAPWLTDAIVRWVHATSKPFASRFAWPRYPRANLDSKTLLPPYAHFIELADLFAAVGGLARAECTVCFLDLAGFREFNNTYGQELGDAVLAAIADELRALPASCAIRDGGDELLVVGAPTGTDLGASIEELRDRWPSRFRERFGTDAPPVVARFLTAEVAGAHLRRAREVLGRAVGDVKHLDARADPRGLRVDLGRIT